MIFIFAMTMAFVFVMASYRFWDQVQAAETDFRKKAFWVWTIKGFAVPAVLWAFVNAGLFSRLPPLLPAVAFTSPGQPRFYFWLDVTAVGLLVTGSYWTMVTAGWLLHKISLRVSDRRDFLTSLSIWSLILIPIAALVIHAFGWNVAGLAGSLWLWPMVYGSIDTMPVRKPVPSYSGAIAAMQFDKFAEAEAAVIKELEKREDDFDGWMLLAELYATQFNDLAGAERTVRETCAQPNVTVSQVNVAFHRLADWHLRLSQNPAGARDALLEICRRCPGTHLDRMAQLRIDQLPADRDELIERRTPKKIRLPGLIHDFNPPVAAPVEDPAQQRVAQLEADRCVEKLKRDPNDVAARENLASIWTEKLNQINLGLEQLELLLAMPEQPDQKMAEWLGLTAAWQLRYQNDEVAARKTLKRLLRDYPETAQAFAAQKRITLLDEAARIRQVRARLQVPAKV